MSNMEKWLKSYEINKNRVDGVYKFASENVDLYNKFMKTITQQMIKKANNNRKLIIYYSFLDSINAVSKTKLKNIGNSMEAFVNKLDEYNFTNAPLNFEKFIKHFNSTSENIDDYFSHLKNTYPGLGYKTTSLFIKELHLADKYFESNLFDNYPYNNFSFKIALESVIAAIFNNVLKLDPENAIIPGNHFRMFHDFINQIEYDQEIVESFWFWGYFNRNPKNGNIIQFNQQKFYANPFFYPGYGNEFCERLKKFEILFNNK